MTYGGQDRQVPHAWTIANRDKSLPDHQVGEMLSPGTGFGRTPIYRFPSYLGFRIVERWQFHYSQVVKSQRGSGRGAWPGER